MAEKASNDSVAYAYGAAGGTLGTVCGALFGLLFLLFVLKIYSPTIKKQLKRDRSLKTEGYSEIYKILLMTIAPVILSTAIYNISETIDIGMFGSIIGGIGTFFGRTFGLIGTFQWTLQCVDQHSACSGKRTRSIFDSKSYSCGGNRK